MDKLVYEILHIFGLTLTFVALGGLTLQAVTGAGGERGRKLVGISHGVALVIVAVSGFGMLAKLGVGFPLWVWLKIVLWLLVGALLVPIRRLPRYATVFWFALPVLSALGAYIALYKIGG